MVFNKFRIQIIIRIALLLLVMGLIYYFLVVELNYIRTVFSFVLLMALCVELFNFLTRVNRDYCSFINSILHEDFSLYYSKSKGEKSLDQLYKTYNQLINKFHRISSEKEMNFIYLQTLVEHVKVGIISYNENNQVELVNTALKKMLNIPALRKNINISVLPQAFRDVLQEIKTGQNRLVKISVSGNLLQLAIRASEFKLEDKAYKLISVQNIKAELDKKEMESWHKLIRVLTHEIMNSITPITSLAGTLTDVSRKKIENNESDIESLKYINSGLGAIKNRSEGLLRFTENYKKLTKLPNPNFIEVSINDLCNKVKLLFMPIMESKNIKFEVSIKSESLSLCADENLLEQVLINLINNAIEAMENTSDPAIKLEINENSTGKFNILIIDKGPGIPDEILEEIFVPFYTTKEQGTGIGLNLSQQIMRLHNGEIKVTTMIGKGTVFTLSI